MACAWIKNILVVLSTTVLFLFQPQALASNISCSQVLISKKVFDQWLNQIPISSEQSNSKQSFLSRFIEWRLLKRLDVKALENPDYAESFIEEVTEFKLSQTRGQHEGPDTISKKEMKAATRVMIRSLVSKGLKEWAKDQDAISLTFIKKISLILQSLRMHPVTRLLLEQKLPQKPPQLTEKQLQILLLDGLEGLLKDPGFRDKVIEERRYQTQSSLLNATTRVLTYGLALYTAMAVWPQTEHQLQEMQRQKIEQNTKVFLEQTDQAISLNFDGVLLAQAKEEKEITVQFLERKQHRAAKPEENEQISELICKQKFNSNSKIYLSCLAI